MKTYRECEFEVECILTSAVDDLLNATSTFTSGKRALIEHWRE
jgi:hypothetical protein